MSQESPHNSKISINWNNDEITSIEVNGIQYSHPDEIPNDDDRKKVLKLMARVANPTALDDDFDFADADPFPPSDSLWPHLQQSHVPQPSQPETWPVERIIFWIFFPIGVSFLTIAGIATYSNQQTLAKEQRASGQVVDLVGRNVLDRNRRPTGYMVYAPVVDFQSADRQSHRIEMSEASQPPAYEKGEQVTILYNPAHPSQARIDSFGNTVALWILPGIFGFLGSIFFIIALVIRKVFSTPKNSEF
ncbi:DUF3592 domain-containing protein [Alkalinema sp. FACHB-956]|uniref:DUF3592 domain-containing protein n=1 Tax=Alkalinema sp. FACHB-956 TaxID=2692768 RepID=UPI0016828581|nr:DUF3592 domain-containing protein [Alkalinema sp. FACHB-956]MBD2328079.1 DUF3592 domain-containing protein [Alkalinema sp. FACHB-956]